MICGKCGANVPDGYEFCMKCGAKIDISQADSTASAVVETKPEKKGINKKVLIPVVAAIVIVLTVVAILFGMKGSAEKNGYFANIPWGTDMETVQKKVDKAFKCESSIAGEDKDVVFASIKNYDGMKGVNPLLLLRCEDKGTLNRVSIIFTAEDDSRYTGEEIADKLIGKYDKLFGKADNRTSSMGYSYNWKTKNSTIKLLICSEDLIILYYTSI